MSTVFPEILPSAEARIEFGNILKKFRTEGASANPVYVGAHRKPEVVMLSAARYEAMENLIEDLQIAALVRERSNSVAEPLDLGSLAASVGLNPADYE